MSKIIAIIGSSGSGKTTYIEKNIIGDKEIKDDTIMNIPVSIVDNTVLFGKYNVDKRCKGCDTLSMAIIDKLIQAMYTIIENKVYDTIVIDGDRITNQKMFEFLMQYKMDTEIIYINTPLDKIFKRIPNCNKSFVKLTYTKSKRMFHKYLAKDFATKHIKDVSTGVWF